jgi:ectoine hydroxylase-related dioxygenase (phytanoyl-CoA dioxygenase family)
VKITDRHLDQLRRDGFAVVRGFLGKRELAAAQKAVFQLVPTEREWREAPGKYQAIVDEEPLHKLEFPHTDPALNHVAVHPNILDAIERLLGTPDILLARSAVWAKYAGSADYDQEMHVDFEGNTLVVPRDDGDYRQVNLIVYYSDVDEQHGPTMVVPRRFINDDDPAALWPARRYRQQFPEAYEHEQPVLARAGDLLMFSMRTFHRGSQITAAHGTRFTHHLVYRSARHLFQGYQCWPSFGELPLMQQFLEWATPRQREAIGFPAAGDPYWNDATIQAVSLRYPDMDMSPYRRKRRRP